VVRDLSTVEELELALALSRYTLHLCAASERLTPDQIASLMETHGKQLRAAFIAKHGYPPEDSTRPRPMSPSPSMVPKIMMPIMPKNIRKRTSSKDWQQATGKRDLTCFSRRPLTARRFWG